MGMRRSITIIEDMADALKVAVSGMVQGVGFRPCVYRVAVGMGLCGYVRNTESGVEVWVEGKSGLPDLFVSSLMDALPAQAVIFRVECTRCSPGGWTEFSIRESSGDGAGMPMMLPDLAPCSECRKEIHDRSARRWHYPFTNCTHCGPRYSIIEGMPYDRSLTSMKDFPLCPACAREYGDPADRRFHAQPIACPVCGPGMRLLDGEGADMAPGRSLDDLLQEVCRMLKEGKVVALMGVGGFQLLADAGSEATVAALRVRKGRDAKPFAIMVRDMEMAESLGIMSPAEREMLLSRAAPIVLVRRRSGAVLASSVCLFSRFVGMMLPSSPLHELLMERMNSVLVVTSGNLSGEPLCVAVDGAVARLGRVADALLVHDRRIVRPVDDSVVRVVAGRGMVLRRARGYAPAPVWRSEGGGPTILALGADLKNTVCWVKNGVAVMSQHIGDLVNVASRNALAQTVGALGDVLNAVPDVITVDAHPDGSAADLGRRLGVQWGVPVIPVQHHVAHVWACVAENVTELPALGVAWDGTGYGDDGSVWGGEWFLMDGRTVRRCAHLRGFMLPGADEAAREPARVAYSIWSQMSGGEREGLTMRLEQGTSSEQRQVLAAMLERNINVVSSSSMGRLFDAVAFFCGFNGVMGCEGHAAMMLESWAAECSSCFSDGKGYVWAMSEVNGVLELDWRPVMQGISDDLLSGLSPCCIARKFHECLAHLLIDVSAYFGMARMALAGGCFQNAFLLETAAALAESEGISLSVPQMVPCNDGGISLGQAVAIAVQYGK